MDLYAENILDHFRSPRGQELMQDPSIERREENTSCGDELTLRLRIDDEKITGVSWTGTGCAISQSAMSMLSEELMGMTLADADALTKESIYALLGVPIGPRRFKCALLGLHTLKNALRLHGGETEQSWTKTVGMDLPASKAEN